jgi:nucleotide-binding universal stress UspA family protein
MTFKKILCPIDFSDGAQEAMRIATQLAKETSAELVLIHVWQPPFSYAPEAALSPDLSEVVHQNAEQNLAKKRAEAEALCGARVGAILLMGTPWDRIVETTKKDQSFDLLVIGTHGRTGLKRVLLGSVSEQVVRHASCPVLVVRDRS